MQIRVEDRDEGAVNRGCLDDQLLAGFRTAMSGAGLFFLPQRTPLMTPWAELLLRPSATDEEIRRRFHELARDQHPDRPGIGHGQPGRRWYAVTTAYSAVKMAVDRVAWERARSAAARLCQTCEGTGVQVKRLGGNRGISVCQACRGSGRR